jgi:ABC-type branched-subunit amino acid transport system substrate-binding protein
MRTRRWLARSLAVVAALSLVAAACGDDDDDTSDTTGTTEEGTETTEATDEGTETTEAAGEAVDLGTDTVTVGLISFFSGPLAVLGTSQESSVQAQIDLLTEAGVFGDTTIELETKDAPDPGAAAQAAQELAADSDVGLIIGPSVTAFYSAAAPILEQSQKINCQPAVAGDVGFGTELQYGFRTQPTAETDLNRLIPYLAEQGYESVGLVYENDATGAEYDTLLQEIAPANGMEYLGYQANNPQDQTHRPYVEALADADVIIASNQPAGAGKTALAAEEIGYEGILAGGSGLQGAGFIEPAGDAALGSVFVSWPIYFYTQVPESEWPEGYAAHTEAVQAVAPNITAPNTGTEFLQGTPPAGDCVELRALAVADAGSLDPDAVKAAWESLSVDRGQLPTDAAPEFSAEDHDALDADDLVVYSWQTDDQGNWYLEVLDER